MTTAVARAEDRAASLALEAICGRTVNLATGIVMHQHRLAADDAENMLRRSARIAGRGLAQVAAGVVRSGAFAASAVSASPRGQVSDLVLVPTDSGDVDAAVNLARRPAPAIIA
jgi:hypothetical protein